MAWDGHYRINMFHKAPQTNGIVRVPTNLQDLLDQEDEAEDPAYTSAIRTPSPPTDPSRNFANTSIMELIEGDIEHEEPFSDDELDPMIDNFAEDEVWNNAEWRKRLENKLHKKIRETEEYNKMLENDPTKKFFRKREIDPYWNYLLDEIEFTDGHDQLQAASNEVIDVDDGIYSEQAVILQNESQEDDVMPALEGDTNEEATTESVDVHNQGLIDINPNDLEPTQSIIYAEEQSNATTNDTEERSFANETRDAGSSSESSSEDDQIVVITGNEIGRNDEDEEILQNENNTAPVQRRFDYHQFKANLKILAARQPFKLVQKTSNKTL